MFPVQCLNYKLCQENQQTVAELRFKPVVFLFLVVTCSACANMVPDDLSLFLARNGGKRGAVCPVSCFY